MKRLDDVLNRQKRGLALDAFLALALILAIGIAALGVAKTLAATAGWSDEDAPALTTSVHDASTPGTLAVRSGNSADQVIRD